MDESNFDDLAKRLSATTSRRQAVRLLGGTLAAGALGALLPGRTWAAPGGNSACAKFCATTFGADTPAAKQCTSDAAMHKGLCYTCGPASAGGTQSICCATNSSGLCTSYSSATCCGTGQTCQNGTCVAVNAACPNGGTCDSLTPCATNPNCLCVQTTEATTACIVPTCTNVSCTSSAQCPSGAVCFVSTNTCCGVGGFCIPLCTCLDLQQSCTSDSQCCSGFCSGSCNGTGVGVCCGVGGTPCTSNNDCCCGGICDPVTGCSCFTSGTLIAMADGTSRPIEHIRLGDLVLGNAGRVNRVLEVLLPVLGQRPLYSLNGSNFFVTAGHPFMTAEGWKAVDPSAVPAHLAELRVGRLAVGDRLLNLSAVAVPVGAGRASSAEAVDVRIDAVALRSLVGQPADPATQLYNLRLDGDHTYFANDLLVHNK